MKSVGEVMAIGRNFAESLGKALRSLEDPSAVFSWEPGTMSKDELLEALRRPHDGRMPQIIHACAAGATVDEICAATGIDAWFVHQLAGIHRVATDTAAAPELNAGVLRLAK